MSSISFKIPVAFFLLFVSISASTKEVSHKNEKHRAHSAHQHGSGKMSIAFDGVQGKIDLKIPSESVFGFEHSAKSDADKKQMNDGLKKLETRMAEMVVFEPELKCLIIQEKLEVVAENQESRETPGTATKKMPMSEHSETIATFNIICEKNPAGTKVTFNIQKVFPQMRDMDIDVLIGSSQLSVEARKSGTTLELQGSK